MAGKYDIFKRTKNGEFAWVETTDDLEAAKTCLRRAVSRQPGQYLVFDRQKVGVVAVSNPHDEATPKSESII